ncbi:MAG: S26 family signal peptidase, partial [Ignavibacteria bacterium]|nr:S26 family signal peptidase [Ignavibacteria bacterium]
MKSFLLFIWEIAKIVIIALLIVVPIRYFVFQPFFVKGQSMEPNFSDGDYLIID